MRPLKILAFAFGGLIALLALLILAVRLFVDPNDYKDRIAQAVKASTGRELTLTGDVRLSVFPQLAFSLGHASLGNPAGFGTEPFAVVDRVALRVRLLPLLHRQLEVGRIEIDGLDLRLVKNTDGKGNWEDFGRHEPAPETADTGSGEGLKSLDLAGVIITNSRLSYGELSAGLIGIELGRIAPGSATPVKLQLDLQTAKGAAPIHVAGSFSLTPDVAAKRYRFAGLALEGSYTLQGAPALLAWKFTTPAVDLDLATQTLARTSFDAQLAEARLSGSVAGSKLLDAPSFAGEFDLKPLAPRGLLAQLGTKPPDTRDKTVLSKLAAQGSFAWAGGVARATKLGLQFDDSRLEGALSLDTASGAKDFELALDHIDVDRYLPPPSTPSAGADKEPPFEMPVETLKGLHAKGSLTVGQLTLDGLKLTALRIAVDANAGLAQLAPVKAQLYGGQYTGDIMIDARPKAPLLKVNQTMAGIDVAQVLQDFVKSKRRSGKGTVTTALTAEGHSGDALLKSLRGSVQMNLADGAVEGLDLWYAIAQAESLLQKRELAEGTNTKRTAFDTFKASADSVNGVATTKDLAIDSQLLRVSGQGSANLVSQAIDYRLTATVLKAPPKSDEGVAALTLAAIPVTVTGSFDNPKVRPDLEGLAKARVKQELDKHKDEIKEKLQDKLRGLFNR